MTNESEQRYQQLIQSSPAPINLFEASGEIIWGNDAVLDLLGLDSRDDLIGRSIFEFIHPDDSYTAKQELLAVVEEKTATGPTSMTLHRADGQTRRIRVSTAPGRYDGADIGQTVVIDVTPLNELQTKLEIERGFFENALDALQDDFYVIDNDGSLRRWIDALLDISGYDETELLEMHAEDFFAQADTENVSESISQAFETGEAIVEATVVTKSGKEIPFEFSKRRLTTDGDIAGLVGIGRDVSDRVARDQDLRAVDRLLQHQLRNKLNVILASTNLLQETPGTPVETRVERIADAAKQLLSIFEHHQHIVQLLTDRTSATEIPLAPIVTRIVERTRDTYPAAEISKDVPEDITVSALPELERALAELVENAIVHNDEPVAQALFRRSDSCGSGPERLFDVSDGGL